jgi:hypothetical protein
VTSAAPRPAPQAARLELQRTRQLHPYFPADPTSLGVRLPGEPPGQGPSWQSYACLMRPLLDKAPWLAAWDRQLRALLRFDLRSGGLRGASALQDAFDASCRGGATTLGEAALEAALQAVGVGRAELPEHLAAAAALCAAALAAAGQGKPLASAPRRPQRLLPAPAPLAQPQPQPQPQPAGRGGPSAGAGAGGGKGAGAVGRGAAGGRMHSSLGVAGEGAAGEDGDDGGEGALQLTYAQFVQLVMFGPGPLIAVMPWLEGAAVPDACAALMQA